jgi:hypothetical protein
LAHRWSGGWDATSINENENVNENVNVKRCKKQEEGMEEDYKQEAGWVARQQYYKQEAGWVARRVGLSRC